MRGAHTTTHGVYTYNAYWVHTYSLNAPGRATGAMLFCEWMLPITDSHVFWMSPASAHMRNRAQVLETNLVVAKLKNMRCGSTLTKKETKNIVTGFR